MKAITQYNINSLEHELITGALPDIPISFQNNKGRFDVKLNDDGTLNIYYISKQGFDQLYVSAQSGNVLVVIPFSELGKI